MQTSGSLSTGSSAPSRICTGGLFTCQRPVTRHAFSGRRTTAAESSARHGRNGSLQVVRAEDDKASTNPVKQAEEELPPWVRREQEQKLREKEGGGELPFGVYLIASSLVAIAAVGSIFEWTAKNPIFGVLPPDNFLYTPILGFFALTGLPTAGFLFVKAIKSANEESARQDKLDGF